MHTKPLPKQGNASLSTFQDLHTLSLVENHELEAQLMNNVIFSPDLTGFSDHLHEKLDK